MEKKLSKFRILAIISICLAVFACGCTGSGGENTESNDSDAVKVTVTILPQEEFVESVGGNLTDVFVLVPPGASPHTYEPTASDLTTVADSDIYVIMGSGVEFELSWLDKIKELNPDLVIINSSEGVSMISGSDDGEGGESFDPHIWLSPKNAEIITENIYEGLSEYDPQNAGAYRENADDYIAELKDLDTWISGEIESSGASVIMVSHPAWGYFARDYNLTQIAIEEGGKEPSPAGLQDLIDEALASNVTTIFVSPESATSNAVAIAEAINGTVVTANPLAGDYIDNLKAVAKAFSGEQ